MTEMVRFFTFRRNVRARAGQAVRFLRGHGYYVVGKPTVAGPRARLAALMDQLVAHNPQVHYAEVRPMRTIHLDRPVYPMTMDCSESVTCLYKWAGLADPNGAGYDGTGYTGTLLQHGTAVAPGDAKTGDLVIFGPAPGHHVCMVRTPGLDPLLFSHGSEADPILIRLSQEQRFQPRPAEFRRYF